MPAAGQPRTAATLPIATLMRRRPSWGQLRMAHGLGIGSYGTPLSDVYVRGPRHAFAVELEAAGTPAAG
jgi:hypothetical protein